jgi:hypothetical protein
VQGGDAIRLAADVLDFQKGALLHVVRSMA